MAFKKQINISVVSWLVCMIFLLCAFTKPPVPGNKCYTVKNTRDTVPQNDTTEKIFVKVEIEASYPGGETAWRHFLEKNLDAGVPAKKKAPAGRYTVMIQFVVDREGKVSDITPLTNHGFGMEEEVMRVLKKSPRWLPATQDGRRVRAYRKQPVTFTVLEEEKRKKKDD